MTDTSTESSATESGATEALANRAAWVAALRSGDYRQATGALRVDDASGPTYCCLGVVETLRGATWSAFLPPDDRDPDNDADAGGSDATHHVVPADPNGGRGETVLTHDAMEWLGVAESAPFVVVRDGDDWSVESVTTLNDSREWSFDRIADVVEAQDEDWDGTEDWCNGKLDELRLARDAAEFVVAGEETS